MRNEKSWLLHQENAPVHSALSVRRFLDKNNIAKWSDVGIDDGYILKVIIDTKIKCFFFFITSLAI